MTRVRGGRRGRFRKVGCACLTLLAGGSLASSATAQAPETLRVSRMTMGPGTEVWERFGHNAIWITDSTRGIDLAYNYGLFDFRQQDFLLRFLQGKMRYWMAAADGQRSAEAYQAVGRSVWVQELALTGDQRAELFQFLEWNRQPENKFYDYDYYLDNCSTRVRDALDQIVGGAIKRALASRMTGLTYRDHTRRLLQHDLLAYTGIMLGLGQPVDRPISAWDAGFLPIQLQEMLREVEVASPSGAPTPLIEQERTIFDSPDLPDPTAMPRYLPLFLLAGLLVGGSMLALAKFADRRRWARYGFLALAEMWSLVLGLVGVALAGLWWLTDHQTSSANENLLQANPLGLVASATVVALVMGAGWARRPARWLAVAIALLSAIGFGAKILPAMYQVNGEIIALFLPANVGFALGMWWVTGEGNPTPST